ncbi:trypsin-like serine protease [Pseudomonas sp. ADAK2]|uniref:trypsin-like serine peptidase n=1 Tax=unclassified Pseudomonas TaxID=196821 RepID=UPI001462D1FD|nr:MULTISPECIES: trypsin-like peptidase domain-containing protein [unclassified Pseudomonas]QJI42883.1 trypsin-like serine protease [Pseudomonas sp. ADAK7]QJI49186.1 trypsin-like serine protease [Pseudomonas sp. ADAK2]
MHTKITALSFFALATLSLSFGTFAQTIPESPEAVLLSNKDGQNNKWNGIGNIFKDGRRYCTASLLDTRNVSQTATGPAYILTNAHCASIVSGAISNVPYKGQVQFNYFHDTLEGAKRYDIEKVSWASLASSDVAILELKTSLDTLLKDGITPLKLATTAPTKRDLVHVIGSPGVAPGLRLSTCTQEPSKIVIVKWVTVLTDYLQQDCKGIAPGSSGSPALDASTGEITGVLSGTTNGLSPDDQCFWHGLCDGDKTSFIPHDQATQSLPVDFLSYCFTNERFNIDAQRCTLKPNFEFKSERNADITLHKKPVDRHDKAPTWGVDFSMSTAFYRFKTVRDAHACYSSDQYSGAISTANARIDATIGREAGLYFLCLIGVESAEQRPSAGLRRNTQILTARLVEPVAPQPPEPTYILENYGYYLGVKLREEISRSIWTQYYVGPVGETDCTKIDRQDYKRADTGFVVRMDSLPRTLCSFTTRSDLNTSSVRTDLLESLDQR